MQLSAAGRAALTPSVPGVTHAYQFLNQMMDLYARGSIPRLVQSYAGGVLGAENYTASSICDDALVIDAYLAQRTPDAPSPSRPMCSPQPAPGRQGTRRGPGTPWSSCTRPRGSRRT